MSEEAKRLRDAIKLVLSAFDNARLVPKPGCGVGGQTIEANIRGSFYNGVDAWPIEEARAVLECHVSAVKLDRTYEWSNAAAYRAGRIAQAEEDAEILREQLAKAKRQEQRVTLAIAIRAIERGRNLTETEKFKNLMDALAEFDREESARANIAKLKDGGTK